MSPEATHSTSPEESHSAQATHASTGADGHGDHAEGNPLIKFEPNVALATFITFFILFIVLKKLAWGPMLDNLDRREKAIKESLEQAEKARSEASSSLEEQQRVLADARREAQELLATGREDAARAREEMVAKARQEAEKLVAAGRQAIDQEKRMAIQEVRAAAVDLALSASSRLLRSQVDDAKSRKLVTGYIKELSEQGGQSARS